MTRRSKCHRLTDERPLDVFDLAAAIIYQARRELQGPNKAEFRSVCWGEERLGFMPCPYRRECYPDVHTRATAKGQRYDECLYRGTAIQQELVEFWNSPWCEFLLGGVEAGYARQALGVPTLERRIS